MIALADGAGTSDSFDLRTQYENTVGQFFKGDGNSIAVVMGVMGVLLALLLIFVLVWKGVGKQPPQAVGWVAASGSRIFMVIVAIAFLEAPLWLAPLFLELVSKIATGLMHIITNNVLHLG